MKAKLINHVCVGMTGLIGDNGHDIPDEDVNVLSGPFTSTIGNSPMLAWCLCETENGRRYYVEATNLQGIEPNWEDWTKGSGTLFIQPVDWDSFRREAARDILCAIITDKWATKSTVERAVKLADELVNELKKMVE